MRTPYTPKFIGLFTVTKIVALFVFFLLLNTHNYAQGIYGPTGTHCVGKTESFDFGGPPCSSITWFLSVNPVNYTIVSQSGTNVKIRWLQPFSASLGVAYNSCSAGTPGSVTIPITVTASSPNAVSITGSGSACTNSSSLSFTASNLLGVPSPQYQWMVNGLVVQSGPSNVFTKSGFNNSDVVTAGISSSSVGCLAPSNNITVTVLSTVSIQQTGTFCAGQSTNHAGFTVTGSLFNGTYKWYKNNIATTDNDPTTPSYVYVPLTPLNNGDQIKCIFTSNSGSNCPAGGTSTSNTITVSTQQPVTPSLMITVAPSLPLSICAGDNITFKAVPNYSTYSVSNFRWTLDDNDIPNNNTNTFSTTNYNQGSILRVNAVAAGCVSSTTMLPGGTQGYPIYVNQPPSVPPIPLISTNTCLAKTLSKNGSPPSNTSWFWQGTNSDGKDYTSTIATAPTYLTANVNGSSSYYIRGKVDGIQCWGPTKKVDVVVDYPSTPNPSNFVYCEWEAMNLTTTGYTSNLKWYTSTDQLITSSLCYVPTNLSLGTYNYKVKNVSNNGCESVGAATVSLVVSGMCDDRLNWTESIVYSNQLDATNNPIEAGHSKSYFDGFGSLLQSQGKNYSTDQVLASQPVNNSLNSPAISTLPAPINSSDFVYRYRFMTNVSGQRYSANDFDKKITTNLNTPGEVKNPNAVGNGGIGTLGWYYSSSNNLEPMTPTTGYPYARGYTPEGPNPNTSTSAGPGDPYKMGSGHEVVNERQPFLKSELNHYFALRPNFVSTALPAQIGPNLFVNSDCSTLTGFSPYGSVTLSAVTQNDETYVKAEVANQGYMIGILPIGGLGSIPVTPGASYTIKVKGYRSSAADSHPTLMVINTRNASRINSQAKTLPDVEDWVEDTFIVPAGCPGMIAAILWSPGQTIGDSFYLNSVSLRENKNIDNMIYGYKVITTDPDGKKTVSFIDADGHELATATVKPDGSYDNWSYAYYNNADQVVATIAPKGVIIDNVDPPDFVTLYKYDQLGRLIETTSTDEGTSKFVYSLNGKIRFSESQVQRDADPKRFSYTNYDYLGRLIESGEYTSNGTNPYVFEPYTTTSPSTSSVLLVTEDKGFINLSRKVAAHTSRCNDYTYIEYDNQGTDFIAGAGVHASQTNTIGRVTQTQNENASTWYSYDEFGQLTWTMQTINGLGMKTIDYAYDYFGKPTQIAYTGTTGSTPDNFYHHYEYDIDQRLTAAYSSLDGVNKTLQAKYYYYLHGPLKRVELGNKIQGIDYVYNVDGSLKLINNADPNLDPGQDGIAGVNASFMKDVFGETLDYNAADYTGASYNEGDLMLNTTTYPEQFSGLIKAVRWHSAVDSHIKRAYAFTYDNLNQLDNADWGNITGTGNYTFTPSVSQAYKEDVTSYDKNGNIMGMVRKGKIGNSLANYSYVYPSTTNKLTQVTGGTAPINYLYNSIGQMIQQSEGADTMNLTYNAFGLVKEVRNANNNLLMSYFYDDRGNRIRKAEYSGASPSTLTKDTYYVSDAAGNTMAVYEQNVAASTPLQLTELPVYAGGHIAIYKPLVTTNFYEVSDHLGNVRGVIGNPQPLTFTATLEDNGNANLSNPRVQEMAYFKNLTATAVDDSRMNKTLPTDAMPVPKYSSYLKWISGLAGQDAAQKSIGPAINLRVEAGDKVDISTWVKYKKKTGAYSRPGIVGAMASILGSSYVGTAPGLDVLANAVQVFQTGVAGAVSVVGGNGYDSSALPYAYVYYLLYDRSFNFITKGYKRVTTAGGFDAGYEALSSHEKLTIPTVTIDEPGYIYIFVSNESENTEVWFDDLQITQQRSSIVAGADFYPFGLAMENREATRENYRYGYQGQFSEKDKTTGWNEFELRMYDARIGRWVSPDPYGQFSSPYVGMGNIPTVGADANGGWIIFANKAHALRVAADINRVFRQRYNINYDVISVADHKIDGQKEAGGKFVTNKDFDWNVDEDAAAVFDVLNVDKNIVGSLVNGDNVIPPAKLGDTMMGGRFVVHTDVPDFPNEFGPSMGIVAIHEFTFHIHGQYSTWISSHNKVGSGSNQTYVNWSGNSQPRNPIKQMHRNRPVNKGMSGHDATDATFVGRIVTQAAILNVLRNATGKVASKIVRTPRYRFQ